MTTKSYTKSKVANLKTKTESIISRGASVLFLLSGRVIHTNINYFLFDECEIIAPKTDYKIVKYKM